MKTKTSTTPRVAEGPPLLPGMTDEGDILFLMDEALGTDRPVFSYVEETPEKPGRAFLYIDPDLIDEGGNIHAKLKDVIPAGPDYEYHLWLATSCLRKVVVKVQARTTNDPDEPSVVTWYSKSGPLPASGTIRIELGNNDMPAVKFVFPDWWK